MELTTELELKQALTRYKKNILNVQMRITEYLFHKWCTTSDKLCERLDTELNINPEEIFECVELQFNYFNDYAFQLDFSMLGNLNSNVSFSFDGDYWIARVIKNGRDETFISECKTINKFCKELLNSLKTD